MGRFDSTDICPICAGQLRATFGPAVAGLHPVDCSNCGRHRLTYEAAVNLRSLAAIDGAQPRIAHAVYRAKDGAIITAAVLESMHQTSKLPGAIERIDNLLLVIGEREQQPGEFVPLNLKHMRAALVCVNTVGTQWVMQEAQEQELVRAGTSSHYTLTLKGRQQLQELLRRGANSVHAFMAMDFNETATGIGQFYRDHLIDAVAATGFQLRTTNHPDKTAGVIDTRMRVELRTSRFVVCDLSDANHGAYWEAGFAEGLGRPVFYLCHADAFASTDKHTKPHFDTAHQPIIRWTLEDPGPALAELQAMIRATLPGEAKMQDD